MVKLVASRGVFPQTTVGRNRSLLEEEEEECDRAPLKVMSGTDNTGKYNDDNEQRRAQPALISCRVSSAYIIL